MSSSIDLRSQAEDALKMTRREVSALPKNDVQRLVYELQVHQIEIEMQNESLRAAQRDLEQSHEQYQELFDCAPAAYLLLDATEQIVRANKAAATLLGQTQLMGRRLSSFFDSEDVFALHEHLRSAQWNRHALCELRLKPSGGEHTHVRVDTSLMPSSAADCLVVLTDISERKRSLEALERLNADLEARVLARTSELATRNAQLETEIAARALSEVQRKGLENKLHDVQRLESLGTLAAGIAHDFNNLLVSVLGNSDLMLLTSDLPSQFREPLELIQWAGRRAAELTREMLTFAGRSRPMFARVSLPLLVVDGLQSIRTRMTEDVQLQTRISSEIAPIDADRGQLHHVVMNLLSNAIEAIEGKGSVSIEVKQRRLSAEQLAEFQYPGDASPGEFAVLYVHDSGPGISAEVVPRIFDPFFTTKNAGRGLGLAAVFGIVHSHRGVICVRTSPGEGTTFEVAFPIAPSRSRPHSEAPRPFATSSADAGSVLVIDDDAAVRGVIAQLLAGLGYTVTVASSGEAGLELYAAAQPRFDLIVLDWQMPGLTGGQVLAAIRQDDADLPVVMISGYNAEDLPAGDSRVVRLQKPMTLAQMREAVQAVREPERKPSREQN